MPVKKERDLCFWGRFMAIISTVFTFVLFSNNAYSQIEDLLNKLESAKEKEKTEILNELALEHLKRGDNFKTRDYAFEAWKLSRKYKNQKQEGIAYQYLGNAYNNLHQFDSALAFQEKAIEIRIKIDDKEGLGKSYYAMGIIYFDKSDNEKSIEYFEKTAEIKKEIGDTNGLGKALNRIGGNYFLLSKYPEAIDYYQKATKAFEKINNKLGIASCLNDIGMIYENYEKFDMALDYYNEALKIYEIEKIDYEIASTNHNIGNFYAKFRKAPDTAIIYYRKALEKRIAIDDKYGMAQSYNNIATASMDISKTTNNKRKKREIWRQARENYELAIKISELIGRKDILSINLLAISKVYQEMGNFTIALDYLERSKEITEEIKLMETSILIYQAFSEVYDTMGNYKEAFNYHRLYYDNWKNVYQDANTEKFAELAAKYQTDKQQKELKIQALEIKQSEEVIKRQKAIRNAIGAGFGLVLVLAVVIYNSLQRRKRDNKIIEAEKEKSEKLLLNTLPAKVVEELKEKGKTEPESFENVSVYFSDVVGFTNMSTNLEPKVLISELNDIFTAFDDIMTNNYCERLKTIGDAYLAVCGMPEINKDHAENMLKSSIEIMKYLMKRNAENELQWRIRVGLHCGKVVGGVVGVRKYIYDVFGDTINTASRMESNSEPMRINVSESFHSILKEKYEFIQREIKEVKGKGKMEMFFLDEKYQN